MKNLSFDESISYKPDFIDIQAADKLFEQLHEHLDWRQDKIKLYGRNLSIPRLQAFIAHKGVRYTYSGLTLEGNGFPEPLEQLRCDLNQVTGVEFNAVLANLYRDGSDTMGWHSDNEPELGPDPVIASITLGANRSFKFRPIGGGASWGIDLEHGSLLLMGAGVQQRWQHSIPKRLRCNQPRINLTFRKIISRSN